MHALLTAVLSLALAAAGPFKGAGKGSAAPSVAANVASFTNTLSVDFDGTNDTVDLGDNLGVNLGTTEFSIVCWFYVSSLATQHYVVAKAAPFAPDINWVIGVNTDGSLFAYFGSAAKTTASAASAITINTWYQAALTVRNITGTFTGNLWLNAVKQGSDVTAPGTTTAPGTVARIGSGYVLDNPNTALPFIGNIDEVVTYNVGLIISELAALISGGKPISPLLHSRSANVTHWYRMGDGDTYPTIDDKVGNVDGTMTNMIAGDIEAVVP